MRGRLSVHTSTKWFYEKPVLFGRYPVSAVPFGRYPASAVPFGRYPVLAVPFGRYRELAVSSVGGTFWRYLELEVLFWRKR